MCIYSKLAGRKNVIQKKKVIKFNEKLKGKKGRERREKHASTELSPGTAGKTLRPTTPEKTTKMVDKLL